MRKLDRELVIENSEIYQYYFERLVNLALAQFEWHNLPRTCDRLYFERSLLFSGKAAMYKPKGTDFFLSTDYLQRDGFDAYGYPLSIYGITYNAENIETDEWMVLYDNMTRQTLMPKIKLYAKLLWEVHNTFRSNLQQQITPYIVTAPRTQSLSFKNIFNRIMGYQPIIEVKDSFDPDNIKTLDLNVDFKGNEILQCLKVLWAEALSMLGITAETSKKERLIEGEIVMNRQEDILSLNARLLNRIDFCNKMNERFGLNMSVNLSSNDVTFKPFGDYASQQLESTGADEAEAREDDDNG